MELDQGKLLSIAESNKYIGGKCMLIDVEFMLTRQYGLTPKKLRK